MLKVAGEQLKDNLTRSGKNLSIETDLLYLDVVNGRIGIKTVTPDVELDVHGSVKSSDIHLYHTLGNHNWIIAPDINGRLSLIKDSIKYFTFTNNEGILDENNKPILKLQNLNDLDTSLSTNTKDLLLISDGDGTYSFKLLADLTGDAETVFPNLNVGDIQIGVTLPNEIDTVAGDLVLDSATNAVIIRGNASFTNNITATGDTNLTNLLANGNVKLNHITINNNTIHSDVGDLTLSADSGKVNIQGNLTVNGNKIADPVIFSDTIPALNNHGNFWMNTTNGVLYINHNNSWIQPSYTPLLPDTPDDNYGKTIVSPFLPNNVEVGATWFDTSNGRFYVYAQEDGWVQPSYSLLQGSSPYVASTFISDTDPIGAVDGNLWLDSKTGQFYIRVQGTWIEPVTGSATTAQKSTAYTQPTEPNGAIDGDMWMNTATQELFVRHNRVWMAPEIKGDFSDNIKTAELFLSDEWSIRVTNDELHFVYNNVPVFEIANNGLLKVSNDIVADGDVQ